MCTLIIGRKVLGPGTVLLGANRDERPERPTDPPGVLSAEPYVVGGRDAEAGGTWLAVREGRAAVAILNRREPPGAKTARARRSRGLLAIDVATAPDARIRAREAVAESDYAPFSLVYASPEAVWLLAFGVDRVPRMSDIDGGWHVLTHTDLDDEGEPRTKRLLGDLAGFQPSSLEEALQRLGDLLRSHGDERDHPAPPVCLHDGVMRTVSSSLVFLAPDRARYLHAPGRPCEHRYQDLSGLLEARSDA